MQEQVAAISVGSFTSRARVELAERLAAAPPAPGVHRLQLYSGGAEAVESALRLAKCHTGKYEFVSFWGGFHGKTMGALSLMGSTFKDKLGPMVPGAHQIPYADCYRCPVGLQYPSCGIACAEIGRKQVKTATRGRGRGGDRRADAGDGGQRHSAQGVPARGALAGGRARRAADRRRDDHRASGAPGSAGAPSTPACEPDVVTIGKAFGGGFPLSGLLTTDEISAGEALGQPVGLVVELRRQPAGRGGGRGRAAHHRRGEAGRERARRGRRAQARAASASSSATRSSASSTASGLLIRMELVKDKKTKEPLPRRVTERIFTEAVRRGLLTMAYAASFRIQPALTIDEATARNGVAILREVFDVVERERLWQS